VQGAVTLTPDLGERMLAGKILATSVFVRELLPQDLKLDIEHLNPTDATDVASYLGNVIGSAHAQQMSEQTRKRWRDGLKQNRSKSLDAPSWLWKSVVELVKEHEGGYLEHCRRFAHIEA
jgi:uncharacterized protein (DUF2252 family)